MSNEKVMELTYYKKHVNDKKHNVQFDKDKVFYKGHTFDAVLSKEFRKHVESVMAEKKLNYPLIISVLSDPSKKQYFTKPKPYDYTNKETGVVEHKVKTSITILSCVSIGQGEFSGGRTLDEVVDEIDGIDEEE